jgi:hypothetical protein
MEATMELLKQPFGWTALLLGAAAGLVLFPLPPAQADSPRLELVGAYRYHYNDPVTLAEAKNIACTEAVRLAVDTSRFFIDATSSVVESQLVKDLVQRIASGYLKDTQVLEQSEKGRTVYCKIRTFINPEEVKVVILTELNRSQTNESPGIDQNRALKILSAKDVDDGTVEVVFKALRRLDWLGTEYDGSLRESADLMIDFYDEKGVALGSQRYPAHKTSAGDVMNPGQIGTHKFTKPQNARSFRVWLVK